MKILSCDTHYNWFLVRDFLQKRTLTGVENVSDNGYTRQTPEGLVHAEFLADKHCFAVSFLPVDDDGAWTTQADDIRSLKHVLGLGSIWQDIAPALITSGMPKSALIPVAIAGCWSPYEALIRAILGQQVTVTAAITQLNKLHALVQCHGGRGFFSPQALLEADLAGFRLPERRKQSLLNASAWVAEHGLSDISQVDTLLDIKGIGPWTVNYVKLRGFAAPYVMLDNDLIIKQQLQQHPLSSDKASPWRSYFCLQLWQWSTLEKMKKTACNG